MIGCQQPLRHWCAESCKYSHEKSVFDALVRSSSSASSYFTNMGNPRVFFDISINGKKTGRIIIEVRKSLDYLGLLNLCPSVQLWSFLRWNVFCIHLYDFKKK